ncbi:hypothetical protein [Tepidimonas taiwanensis]|uniref:hypothetical protein n=1 Tax=Tepidimonas taiwanensis TaxID=307486 RepID=UPI0018CED080|nr:hypothetical protein [Tepidimonas taiwanensis]
MKYLAHLDPMAELHDVILISHNFCSIFHHGSKKETTTQKQWICTSVFNANSAYLSIQPCFAESSEMNASDSVFEENGANQ